jgi:hypothetical protein
MTTHEKAEVSTGELISGAFAELGESKREVAMYLGAFLLANIANELEPGDALNLATLVGYFVAQYWLFRVILRKAGFAADGPFRVFHLFGMAIVIGAPVWIGAMFLFVPGIILAAKWVMAPSFLVATDKGVFDSMGASWSTSNGYTLQLSLAFTALFLIFFVLIGIVSVVDAQLEEIVGKKLLSGWTTHFLPLLLMGLSVTAYRQLQQAGQTLSDVFA